MCQFGEQAEGRSQAGAVCCHDAFAFGLMPGLVPGIHVLTTSRRKSRRWHRKSGLRDFRIKMCRKSDISDTARQTMDAAKSYASSAAEYAGEGHRGT